MWDHAFLVKGLPIQCSICFLLEPCHKLLDKEAIEGLATISYPSLLTKT
jgi:hypothetical protein